METHESHVTACPSCGAATPAPRGFCVACGAPLTGVAGGAGEVGAPAAAAGASFAAQPLPGSPGGVSWTPAAASISGAAPRAPGRSGLVLTIAGGFVCLLSTIVWAAVGLGPGVDTGPPVIDFAYWTGLTPGNLAWLSPPDLSLYLADAGVTVVAVVAAIWAVVALAGGRRPPWGLVLGVGAVATCVFLVELALWNLDQGFLGLPVVMSFVGAALLIVGGVQLRPDGRPAATLGDRA